MSNEKIKFNDLHLKDDWGFTNDTIILNLKNKKGSFCMKSCM